MWYRSTEKDLIDCANALADLDIRCSHMLSEHFPTLQHKEQQCHQHGDMHIDATVTFVQIYGKLTKKA